MLLVENCILFEAGNVKKQKEIRKKLHFLNEYAKIILLKYFNSLKIVIE